jgi:hypothetical protein
MTNDATPASVRAMRFIVTRPRSWQTKSHAVLQRSSLLTWSAFPASWARMRRGPLARIKVLRREAIEPKVKEHHGRLHHRTNAWSLFRIR